jgi:hypothetical protein
VRALAPCCGGRLSGNDAVELASQLQEQELLDHIDLGNLRSVAGQDSDEVIGLEPLERLAHRGAADPQVGAELRLRPDAAGRQLE